MKYFIISDIHSNLEALTSILKQMEREKPDIKVCLGDIVGYGPNPDECTELVFSAFDIIIAGNHDQAVTGQYSTATFNPLARMAVEWSQTHMKNSNIIKLKSLEVITIKNDITFVHATPHAPERFGYILSQYEAKNNFPALSTSLCFIGHTHVPRIYMLSKNGEVEETWGKSIHLQKNNKYIFNVGSVGQPRDRSPLAGYAIYDSTPNTYEIKRLSYDIAAVQKKMKQAGLPSFLISRLARGA